ncbi:hypothetical protein DMENIID0001_132050 [Sergentomyia squamirostris]
MRINIGDNLPFRMTIGTGITCVIGVLGSALLLVQGARYFSQVSQRRNLRKKRSSDANQESSTRSSSCYLCNIRVALEDITTYAICRGCDRTVCRGRRCSDWDRTTGYWECVSCIRGRDSQIRAGEWILDQLNQRFKSPRSDASREDLSFKDAETQSERSFLGSSHSISLEQKEKVREFLEDIIASMIGGPLENVPVNQIHRHPSYLQIFACYHRDLSGCLLKLEKAIHQTIQMKMDLPIHEHECPGVAHVNLKRLIQKVIEEALNLPDLFDLSGYPPRPESHLPYFSTKKYEQLLATAVLNKVIDHYKNPKNHAENSSGIQSGSELDSNHNALTEKTSLLSPSASVTGQKALDKRLEEASQTSDSSLKTRSTESDETYLSDYIQSHRVPLPDLSAASSEGTVDDNSSEVMSTAGTEGTWEENWLFKKRKVKSDTNSTAIGMLVPSPTEEVKALIGDKNIDEVSDLSEAGSDGEDDSPVTKLIESKTIIGGKNELISLEETSSATDSLLSNPDSGINVTEARNEVLLIDGDFVESGESENPTQAFNENVVLNGTEAPIPSPRTTTENVEEIQISQNHDHTHADKMLDGQEVALPEVSSVTLTSEDLYRKNFLWKYKPEILSESAEQLSSPGIQSEWVVIHGCWEVRDPNESILINSGQYTSVPIPLNDEEIKDSMNHQVLSPDNLYGYRYLNDLKPDKIPRPEPLQEDSESEKESADQCRPVYGRNHLNDLKPKEIPIAEHSQETNRTFPKEESILISSGQYKSPPIGLNEEEIKDSMNYQVLSSERLYGYRYLNDLKPNALPTATKTEDSQENTLPTPEVELSNTEEFVCVMTYDEKRQLIICGSPMLKRREPQWPEIAETETSEEFQEESSAAEENWEPQVCERVAEETRETPPAAEQVPSTDFVGIDSQNAPVPLPRHSSFSFKKLLTSSAVLAHENPQKKQTIQNAERSIAEKKVPEVHARIEEPFVDNNQVENSPPEKQTEVKVIQIHARTETFEEKEQKCDLEEVKIQRQTLEIHLRSTTEISNEEAASVDIHPRIVVQEECQKTEDNTEAQVTTGESPVEIHARSAESDQCCQKNRKTYEDCVKEDEEQIRCEERSVACENTEEPLINAEKPSEVIANNEDDETKMVEVNQEPSKTEERIQTSDATEQTKNSDSSSQNQENTKENLKPSEISEDATEVEQILEEKLITKIQDNISETSIFVSETIEKSEDVSSIEDMHQEKNLVTTKDATFLLNVVDKVSEDPVITIMEHTSKTEDAASAEGSIVETVKIKQETSKDNEKEVNAKIDEILQYSESGQTHSGEIKESDDIKDKVRPPKTPTEEEIMHTSLEIKEKLQKMVKLEEEKSSKSIERPKTLQLETQESIGDDDTVHLRYKSPIFQSLLPKSPPAVVKISAIPGDDSIGQLINVANIIKRSSLNSPPDEQMMTSHQALMGDGCTKHDQEITNKNVTNNDKNATFKNATNAESIETVTKHRDSDFKSDSPEPDSLEDEHLIPGSIAEREHLKWQHPDADIPNNPYSPEALQQRLVVLNAQQHNTTQSQNVATNIDSSTPKTPERSLQVVLGENSPDHKRYGRDYYINDAKKSSGTRKKPATPSDDFPSRSSEEDKVSVKVVKPQILLNDDEAWHVTSHTTTSSYILNKFLEGSGHSDTFVRNTSLRRSVSLKSFRAHNLLDEVEVHSVDRRKVRKTNSFRPTPKEVATFEAQMLHNDLRRNSFRARKGTANFVLNPIFDDPMPETAEEDLRPDDPLARLRHASSTTILNSPKLADLKAEDSDTESNISWRFVAGNSGRDEAIETVFDDLNSLRRRPKNQKKILRPM